MSTLNGPLGGSGQAPAESDVIFTAALLGFALTRAILHQSVSFDAAHGSQADELSRLASVVDRLVAVIGTSGISGTQDCAGFLVHGMSPEHGGEDAALITGSRGGEAQGSFARNRVMSDAEAISMAVFEYRSAQGNDNNFAGQYHGRGAYTGMIDDIIGHHTLIQPTLRRTIREQGRWHPDPDNLWGLIGSDNRCLTSPLSPTQFPNLSDEPDKGMGPLRRSAGIVQYVHGMSWAMRDALRWGPWTTAYEMAVGQYTKKRASCFACSTYMWSSGFPASSTHLGRCESWGPLPDGSLHDEDHVFSDGAEGRLEQAIASSMNIRWHIDMYHQIRRGSELLLRAPIPSPPHRAAAERLNERFLASNPEDARNGGKLFLDAITWHRADIDRVCSTLAIPSHPLGNTVR